MEAKHTNFLHPGPGPAKLRLSQTGILSSQYGKVGNIGNLKTSGGPKKIKRVAAGCSVCTLHTARHDGKGNLDKTLVFKTEWRPRPET